MKIEEITNKTQWEDFLSKNKEISFLQSWNWGEFNTVTGEKIWRLGIFDGDNLETVTLVIKVKARRGSFLFVPYGPVYPDSFDTNQKEKILSELTSFF